MIRHEIRAQLKLWNRKKKENIQLREVCCTIIITQLWSKNTTLKSNYLHLGKSRTDSEARDKIWESDDRTGKSRLVCLIRVVRDVSCVPICLLESCFFSKGVFRIRVLVQLLLVLLLLERHGVPMFRTILSRCLMNILRSHVIFIRSHMIWLHCHLTSLRYHVASVLCPTVSLCCQTVSVRSHRAIM